MPFFVEAKYRKSSLKAKNYNLFCGQPLMATTVFKTVEFLDDSRPGNIRRLQIRGSKCI
jgi:hypothetical protein